jgi:putative sterol carrier protein
MSLEQTTTAIRDKVGERPGFGSRLKIDLGNTGVIHIDGTATPTTVSNEDAVADCTVRVSLEDLNAMMNGDLDPMSAFAQGKIQLDGDMSVAMQLGSLM